LYQLHALHSLHFTFRRQYLTFPKMGSQMQPHYQLRDVCCHLTNMIEDIDKAAVCCVGCHYEPIDVAFRQITLALVVALYHSSIKRMKHG